MTTQQDTIHENQGSAEEGMSHRCLRTWVEAPGAGVGTRALVQVVPVRARRARGGATGARVARLLARRAHSARRVSELASWAVPHTRSEKYAKHALCNLATCRGRRRQARDFGQNGNHQEIKRVQLALTHFRIFTRHIVCFQYAFTPMISRSVSRTQRTAAPLTPGWRGGSLCTRCSLPVATRRSRAPARSPRDT